MVFDHKADKNRMGTDLQHRIDKFAGAVTGDSISIPELVTAFPEVNAEVLAAALLEMTKIGRISVSGALIKVMAERHLRPLQ